jgi:anaerobic glycerol-3-phosphate dehydrogenase
MHRSPGRNGHAPGSPGLLPDRHPCRLVGEDGVEQALEKSGAYCRLRLGYVGSPRVNRTVLTPLGTFKTTS